MGPSAVTDVSLWCRILIKEKAMHVGGREDGKSLCLHLSFAVNPKLASKNKLLKDFLLQTSMYLIA